MSNSDNLIELQPKTWDNARNYYMKLPKNIWLKILVIFFGGGIALALFPIVIGLGLMYLVFKKVKNKNVKYASLAILGLLTLFIGSAWIVALNSSSKDTQSTSAQTASTTVQPTKTQKADTSNIAPKVLGMCPTTSTGNYVVTNCVNIQLPDISYPSRNVYVVIDPANDSPKTKVQTVATQASALCEKVDCVISIFDDTQAANEQYKEDLLSQAAAKEYIKDPKNSDAVSLTTDHLIANFTPPSDLTYLFIPSPTPTPTPTPIAYDANGFPEDAQQVTVSQVAKVPSSYEGKKITFTCTVLSFPKDSNGNAAGLNCSDPNDYSSILQVSMGTFDQSTNINQNDSVAVYGMGQGASSGTNAYGGQVTEAVVLELHLKDFTTGYSE